MAENSGDTEIAWAAGFFDGEGSSSAGTMRMYAGKPYCYPRISVKQAHRGPLVRFAKAVGGSLTGPDKQGAFRVQASGRRAHEIMDMLWPYLCKSKRRQFHRAVKLSKERCNG